MIALSYPFAWTPVAIVVGVLVLLNAWLAVLAALLLACLLLAAVVALVWLGVAQLIALAKRGWHALSSPPARGRVVSESHREAVHS